MANTPDLAPSVQALAVARALTQTNIPRHTVQGQAIAEGQVRSEAALIDRLAECAGLSLDTILARLPATETTAS